MSIHELLYKDKLLKGTNKLKALGILDGAELTVRGTLLLYYINPSGDHRTPQSLLVKK